MSQEKIYIQNIIKEVLSENELLSEGIVLLPDDVMAKIQDAYNRIKDNFDNIIKQVPPGTENPLVFPEFDDYFVLKNLKGEETMVSLGLINDSKGKYKGAYGFYDRLVVVFNLAYWESFDRFEITIEHELIHAIDPKLRGLINIMVANRKKYGDCLKAYRKNKSFEELINCYSINKEREEEQMSDMTYHKKSYEIDAHMAPMIRTMKKSLDAFGEKMKKNLPEGVTPQKALFNFLLDIEKHPGDPDTIIKFFEEKKYPIIIFLFFMRNPDKTFDKEKIMNNLENNVVVLANWATRPTLYKKFLKYVYTELNK